MRKFHIILVLLLIGSVQAGMLDEASEIEQRIRTYVDDPEDVVIVIGKYASAPEKLAVYAIKDRYPDLKDVKIVKEEDYTPGKKTVILIGGPYQNGLTSEIVRDNEEIDKTRYTAGIISFIDTPEQKYLVFSDPLGYNNLAKTGPSKSPLAKIMPVELVPAAATGLSFFFLWLWHVFSGLGIKILKKKAQSRFMKRVKKKSVRHKFTGWYIMGIRIKLREWIYITIAAAVFAMAISYSYLQKGDVFLFILTNITVNLIIYTIRHGLRLLMDRHHETHTEYHLWLFGAVITLVSGWLGNTFALAGYVSSDDKKPKNEAKVKYLVNLLTLLASFLFLVWNYLYPAVILQMCMVFSLSIAFLQFLPMDPFSGKEIYRWKKGLWWITFIPMTLYYIAINLVI